MFDDLRQQKPSNQGLVHFKAPQIQAWQPLINYGLKVIEVEIRSYPCFGLVSQNNNGCHQDMNFELFMKSQTTFRQYFSDIINLVISDDQLNFATLRKIGIKQEARMFQATSNINTHKGLIFNFGIIFYIVAFARHHQIPNQKWSNLIKTLTKPLAKDFSTFNNKTTGEQIYQQYQIKGARGLALSGYQIIFEQALPFLQHYKKLYPRVLTLENQSLLLLVFYLSNIFDTTLIGKIGYVASLKIMETSKSWLATLANQDWKTFYTLINDHNQIFIDQKVSPGGCADLCVITLFLQEFID